MCGVSLSPVALWSEYGCDPIRYLFCGQIVRFGSREDTNGVTTVSESSIRERLKELLRRADCASSVRFTGT